MGCIDRVTDGLELQEAHLPPFAAAAASSVASMASAVDAVMAAMAVLPDVDAAATRCILT